MSPSVAGQTIRYLAVGSVVYAIDVGLFSAIVISLDRRYYLAANVVAKIAAAAVGFLLHRHFTFARRQRQRWHGQLMLYGLLFVLNLGLSSVLLFLSVALLRLEPVASKIAADLVVFFASFVINRQIVFRSIPS
jgi:putative flippase GtrA